VLPVPAKARRRVKKTMEEILLLGDSQMVSRIQKATNIIKESQGKRLQKYIKEIFISQVLKYISWLFLFLYKLWAHGKIL